MSRSPRLHTFLAASLVSLASATVLAAPESDENTPPRFARQSTAFHADIEVDPIAYVLGGYSLHAGLGSGPVRVDIGAFALDLPEFFHGNPDFDVSFNGYGAKLQYFPFAEQGAGFFGVDVGVARQLVQRKGSAEMNRLTWVGLGGHVGWRFDLVGGLYATPWLGVSRTFGNDAVTLQGKTFEPSPVVFFPAVHIGLRLR
jgi:hypothetical protein